MAGPEARSSELRNHAQLIWSIAELLRGEYRQSDYGKVILRASIDGYSRLARAVLDNFDFVIGWLCEVDHHPDRVSSTATKKRGVIRALSERSTTAPTAPAGCSPRPSTTSRTQPSRALMGWTEEDGASRTDDIFADPRRAGNA